MSLRTRTSYVMRSLRAVTGRFAFPVWSPHAGRQNVAEAAAAALDDLLLQARAEGVREGRLWATERLQQLWPPLTGLLVTSVEHAYLDGERAGRMEGGDELGLIAHKHEALRRMTLYGGALERSVALLENLSNGRM